MKIPGLLYDIHLYVVSDAIIKRKYKQLAKTKCNTELLGFYSFDTNSTYINKNYPEDVQLHTLFHELTHSFIAHLHAYPEEQTCDLVSSYLVKLTTDNKFRNSLLVGLKKHQ